MKMDDDSNPASPRSLKHKLRQSLCFSCCFRRRRGDLPLYSPPVHSDDNPTLIWGKIRGAHDHSLLEIKEKCRTALCFAGVKHKRHSSAEFRYDPLSYRLNFEDGFDFDDEAPLKNFSARLLPSPSPVPAAVG